MCFLCYRERVERDGSHNQGTFASENFGGDERSWGVCHRRNEIEINDERSPGRLRHYIFYGWASRFME